MISTPLQPPFAKATLCSACKMMMIHESFPYLLYCRKLPKLDLQKIKSKRENYILQGGMVVFFVAINSYTLGIYQIERRK